MKTVGRSSSAKSVSAGLEEHRIGPSGISGGSGWIFLSVAKNRLYSTDRVSAVFLHLSCKAPSFLYSRNLEAGEPGSEVR